MLVSNSKKWISLLFCLMAIDDSTSFPDYWQQREDIEVAEASSNLGGRLEFQPGEREVNDILMYDKRHEIKEGFAHPSKFLPSRNFLEVRSLIEKSPVYKMIRAMPKGAVLHAHDTAIVSEDFVFSNITHRDNLYVCEVEDRWKKICNGSRATRLSLRFFDKPTTECDWKLLSQVRKDEEIGRTIDRRIRRQLSMQGETFEDGNSAWNKFKSIFGFITPFLSYRPVYEDHFYQGLLELYQDNVMYLELRSTLPTLYDLDGTKYDSVKVAEIYKKVTDRFVHDYPNFFGVKLIYAPPKTFDPSKFQQYVQIATELKRRFPDFYAGFDLVGQEDNLSPLIEWVDQIAALGPNMKFFFHAGETNWNGLEVDKNLIDAVLLNTSRVGHGYALTKHPKVLEIVKEKKIAIEICPISNQVLALVKDMRNHPASSLFIENVPVVVSNDDPGLWGSKALSFDFYEAFMGIMSAEADIRSIKQLGHNSLCYSSLNDTAKQRALSIFETQWTEFVAKWSLLRKPEPVAHNV